MKNVPQGLKAERFHWFTYGLNSLRENSHMRNGVPQGRLNLAQDAVLG